MKKIVDSFCRKHPNFGFPNLMKYIVVANIALWIINIFEPRILAYMTFNPYYILRGQIWRLISFMFVPPVTGYLAPIAFYFYYWIGSVLEHNWGTCRFNIFFFSGIILTVVFGFVLFFITGISYQVSSTFIYLSIFIYLSMFLAFAALFPDMQVLLFFVIPIKIKYLAYLDALLFVVEIIQQPFPFNLLPVVAILNFIIFCGADIIPGKAKRRRQDNVTNFKKKMKEAEKEINSRPYTHKCCVCGKTDTDYPSLDFRYCSQCAGYHCFCEEHINSHIHFTE